MSPRPRDLLRTCPYCQASPAPFRQESGPFTTQDLDAADRWWYTAVCPACGGVILLEVVPNTEDIKAVIPAQSVNSWDIDHLPPDVESHWGEAVSTFNNRNYRSAVVACGRALEAAGKHYGIEKGGLHTIIKQMLDAGLITTQFKEAMDYVRVIRNTGAHADIAVEKHEAEGAMGFTMQTQRLLFEVPGELTRLDQDEDPEAA